MKIGFDNEKYLQLQAEHITARRAQFGGKLYLEFGGKLFDDYHASRVLPGFRPDSKIRMLQTLKDDVEIVVAYKAPLYGRRTAQMKILPFDFEETCAYFAAGSRGGKGDAVPYRRAGRDDRCADAAPRDHLQSLRQRNQI